MASSATIEPIARPQGRASFLSRVFSGDSLALALVFTAAIILISIVALLVFELWTRSALARDKFGFGFLSTSNWNPVGDDYGALPFICGTLVTSALGLLLAIPFGVGSAIFLAELAP